VQLLKLEMHRTQLFADGVAVFDALEGQQHRLDLALAIDQHATLR